MAVEERGITLDIDVADEPTTDDTVFYNTDMVVNRDVSVACLAVYQDWADKELQICDALGGSGVRGLRYLDEVDHISEMVINDKNPAAVEAIETNVAANDVDADRITVTDRDANTVLTDRYRSLDYVDLDPFGSPAPFLDSAARSLFRESALGATATDLAPLYGSYRKVCERRYGSTPLKTDFSHEIGLRILLRSVFEACSRYDIAFQPKLCFHQQHYYRVFGTTTESKKQCNRLLDDIGYLQHCRDCRWRAFTDRGDCIPACPHCDSASVETAGPLWTGRFSDPDFAGKTADWLQRKDYTEAADIVTQVQEECEITTPFYDTHELAAAANAPAPDRAGLLDRLHEQGYRAVETHFLPHAIRTDAPIDAIHAAVDTGTDD